MRKVIYIAGPYTKGDVDLNVSTAMATANELIRRGFAPICPHLFHFMHIVKASSYEVWMDIDYSILLKCDALLRIPGESKGADSEIELAKENNIPVFYSIEDLGELKTV